MADLCAARLAREFAPYRHMAWLTRRQLARMRRLILCGVAEGMPQDPRRRHPALRWLLADARRAVVRPDGTYRLEE